MSSSIIFADSFDDYTDLNQKWANSGGFAISATTVRTGSQSAHGDGINTNNTLLRSFSSRATYIIGAALYIVGLPASENYLYYFYDGTAGSPQVSVTIDGGGNIRARRGGVFGGVVLGTASSTLPAGAWHYLEAKVTVDSSAGAVQLWLDGVQILNLTSQNTSATGNAFANMVGFRNGCSTYIDDLYVIDPTLGGAYSGPLGDVKMVAGLPSGNGTTNNFTKTFATWPSNTAVAVGKTIVDSNGNVQRVTTAGTTTNGSHPTWSTTGGATTTDNGAVWTCIGSGSNPGQANWMAVSEVPPDDDSSYVTDATIGHIDRYTFPSIAGSQVFGVAVNIRGGKDDAGTRTIRACGKSGSTTFDSGTDLALPFNSYQDFQGVFETDPNTGVAWTVSGVNAAEFGVKTTA